MKIEQLLNEHKKGVKAKIYNKKPKPLVGPEALKAKAKAKVAPPKTELEKHSKLSAKLEGVQDKLHKHHQELRKKSGLPDSDYYKELKATYDLPDEERHKKSAELKKKYGVKEAKRPDRPPPKTDLKVGDDVVADTSKEDYPGGHKERRGKVTRVGQQGVHIKTDDSDEPEWHPYKIVKKSVKEDSDDIEVRLDGERVPGTIHDFDHARNKASKLISYQKGEIAEIYVNGKLRMRLKLNTPHQHFDEKDMKEAKQPEAPKPRNFVAKNAKTAGAGAHKDAKKASKDVRGQKHKNKEIAEGEWSQQSDEMIPPEYDMDPDELSQIRNAPAQDDETIAQIVKMSAKGINNDQIANYFDMDQEEVENILNQHINDVKSQIDETEMGKIVDYKPGQTATLNTGPGMTTIIDLKKNPTSLTKDPQTGKLTLVSTPQTTAQPSATAQPTIKAGDAVEIGKTTEDILKLAGLR